MGQTTIKTKMLIKGPSFPLNIGDMPHTPVLYHEVLHALNPQDRGLYVDGTIGSGGHACGILHASSPGGFLLGLDLDPGALSLADKNLTQFADRVILKQASYTTLSQWIEDLGWPPVDGILLDLGVSSMQLDEMNRGFSFRGDAPLDMRFNPNGLVSAEDLVNGLPERELADLIYQFGEEKKSRQVAKAILENRPVHTTGELAEIVSRVVQPSSDGLHPATRTFQAIRIATNDELRNLERVLPIAVNSLASGGKLAVIAFHSLEDRIVKNYFRRENQDCICPPKQPLCTCGHSASLKVITRRPIRPEEPEIKKNPRARSSRLRVAEKL
jgi:16S rRNA (cytosine1402-N4)-methyltransferase